MKKSLSTTLTLMIWGHVTDPYLLWYNEFKATGKDVDTYLGADIIE